MDDNHPAPLDAPIDIAAPFAAGDAPALWNPEAAAAWSLLFSPVFGTWVHLKNWQALGDAGRVRLAWAWLAAAIVVFFTTLGFRLWPLFASSYDADTLQYSQWLPYVFLLAWFFGSAQAQVRTMRARFGEHYARKRWKAPMLWAIGGWAAVFVAYGYVALKGLAG